MGYKITAVFGFMGRLRIKRRELMVHGSVRGTVVVLAAGLGVFGAVSQAQTAVIPRQTATPRQAQTATVQNVPAEYKSGISSLLSAKSALEKAGDKWGGHRVKAIHQIDEALRALGQTPAVSPSEMKSGNTDEPAELQSGISQLNTAKSDFERAGSQWGGRKAKAISYVDEALKELQVGIEYAKEHKTY
jgi:hypothetical protein